MKKRLRYKLLRGNVLTHQFLSTSRSMRTTKQSKGVVFFPGCSLGERGPKLVGLILNHLKSHYQESTSLMLDCCNKPLSTINKPSLLNKRNKELKSRLEPVSEIITACPNCYITLKKLMPNHRIIDLWTILKDTPFPLAEHNLHVPISIHDPCPTRMFPATHMAIESICKRIGLNILDHEYSKDKTLCCGAKDMNRVLDNEKFTHLKAMRINTLPSDIVITYCMECTHILNDSSKQVVYLPDILFGTLREYDYDRSKRWLNRYRLKRMEHKNGA